MNEVTIKLAEVKDIQDICYLVQQMSPNTSHDYREAEQKFKYCIKHNPDYFLWTAKLNNKIVGTAMMHLQHKLSYNCGTAAHLEDVVIDKNIRNRGIGKKLVKHAIKTAKSYNCYKIMLTCWEKTVPYYLKFGFKEHGTEMRMSLKKEF